MTTLPMRLPACLLLVVLPSSFVAARSADGVVIQERSVTACDSRTRSSSSSRSSSSQVVISHHVGLFDLAPNLGEGKFNELAHRMRFPGGKTKSSGSSCWRVIHMPST